MIALIPGQSVPFTIPAHESILPAVRPTFMAKALTCIEFAKVLTLLNAVEYAGDEASTQIVALGLSDWRDVGGQQFAPERLAELASPEEFGQVIEGILKANRPSAGDEKKSESRSQSPTAACAVDASAASATN